MKFHDRTDAGKQLAEKLSTYRSRDDTVVLGLPRGGVPVGFAVAEQLGLPMDTFVVRKVGVPGHEELAMGAVASGGVVVKNDEVIEKLGIPDRVFDDVARREEDEIKRREQMYRGHRTPLPLEGRVGIIVDDGLATGATMRAAVRAVRQRDPREIVAAAPVATPETVSQLEQLADRVVAVEQPTALDGVGAWYEDFQQITDPEVREVLEKAATQFATNGANMPL